MNKNLVLTFLAVVFGLVVVGCGGGGPVQAQGWVQSGLATPQPSIQPTSTATATATIEPSATVDYASTVVSVQQTLDETKRLNVQATSEHEARVHESVLLTARVDEWTATAAPTAVAATSTQQEALNKQIETQQSLMAVQITQTAEAPARLIEMENAQDFARNAPLRTGLEFFIMFSVGVCFLFLTAFLRTQLQWQKRPVMVEQKPPAGTSQVEARDEAVLHQVDMTQIELKDTQEGYPQILRFTVPCSPGALTELAQGLISGAKTFGINSWEGSASENFSRERIKAVRHFLQLNKFAESIGGGRLHLTELGKRFLAAWLSNMNLPAEYTFQSKEVASSENQ